MVYGYSIGSVCRCLAVCFCIFSWNGHQPLYAQIPEPGYDSLYEAILHTEGTPQQEEYLRRFLDKAKREGNRTELVNAYHNYMAYSEEAEAAMYADSMLGAARQSGDSMLIGEAYLSKGISEYHFKRYAPALDDYLKAHQFLAASGGLYLKYKTDYNIALVKYYLGHEEEAAELLKECIIYFKSHHARAYLNSLHCLGLCYAQAGDYGQSRATAERGMAEAVRLKAQKMYPYFNLLLGMNACYSRNYGKAQGYLNAALPPILKNRDSANAAVAYYYLGKSCWETDKREEAAAYFMKMDRVFSETGFLKPELRNGYVLLAGYYAGRGEPEKQLYCLNQLLKADARIERDFKELNPDLYKQYDEAQIRKEKAAVEKRLQASEKLKQYLGGLAVVLFLSSLFFGTRYYVNRKIYRQRFEALMQPKAKTQPPKTLGDMEVKEAVVEMLLKKLDKFEEEQKFLDSTLTLVQLAAYCGSNTKYLSAVIQKYKQQKFTGYINGLRVDYLVKRLQEERRLRHYTQKALAEESGFSSAERLAHAFKSRTGISMSYFICETKKKSAIEEKP